ncbi:MAG TPA: secretin N-terminal domain-containing protein [Planctomycetota bacterium]|nr:secretin N-terminal domain-containing protein [Planctomycetota bacterium]
MAVLLVAAGALGAQQPPAAGPPTTGGQSTGKAAPPAPKPAGDPAQDQPVAPPRGTGQPITLNVQSQPLGQILEALSVSQKVNIVAGVDTTVPVTVNFYEATLEQALDWILAPLGFAWYFDGEVYQVMNAADEQALTHPLVHRVFRPDYLSAAELEKFLTQFLSPRGRLVLGEPPEIGIPSGGDSAGGISSDQAETLIVIDEQARIDVMISVVADLDRRPKQVLVEATILEVTLDEVNRFGVDIAFVSKGFEDFESIGAPGQVYSDPTLVAPGDLPGGLAAGAPFLTPTGSESFMQGGFTENDGEGLRMGYVGDNVAFFIEALQKTADTNVLANTKVLALNKMRGELIIGGRLGYYGGTTVSDGISQQTVEFLEVGTQLRFRPFIAGDGFVRLEIHPQRSSGVVDSTTGLPSETTSEVTTNVMVRDGETVVIGGLIESRDVHTIKRVPFLGYLPVIGWLFSSEKSEVVRKEIIVLLTPRVLEDGRRYEDGQRLQDLAEARRDQMRQNYGPIARVEYASEALEGAKTALAEDRLSEARRLCDRALLFDPLAEGAVELSQQIDGRIAEELVGESGPPAPPAEAPQG